MIETFAVVLFSCRDSGDLGAYEERSDEKVELWDIYDACLQKTGKLHERGKELERGDYHLVVHIYPVNEKKEVLMQKRSETVEWFPGCWAATGGSAIAGENFWEACQRELKEELGVTAKEEDSELAAIFKRVDSFNAIWIVRCNMPKEALVLQKEEVADAEWMDFNRIRSMTERGLLHKYHYIDWLETYIEHLNWE